MMYRILMNCFTSVKSARPLIYLLSMSAFLSGCLPLHVPVEATYIPGAVVTSLSSSVSLSYASPDRSISGSGVLMYRKPDQMRVVILSPFGSVLQEVYVSGDQVTIIDPGNGIAFSGVQADLPDKGDFSGWRYIHWLIDIDPFDPSRKSADIERVNRFGQSEHATFEKGLLTSKSTTPGGSVTYAGYTAAQGASLPLEITYETVAKEKFTLLLEDPEVNAPFADDAFSPSLSKLRVYPLSSLK